MTDEIIQWTVRVLGKPTGDAVPSDPDTDAIRQQLERVHGFAAKVTRSGTRIEVVTERQAPSESGAWVEALKLVHALYELRELSRWQISVYEVHVSRRSRGSS
jgi:hypothetical protein